MYQLYHSPSSAAMTPHMLLRELDLPFRLVPVDTKNLEQRSEAYLRLNPEGRIPTLVDGDLVLTETAAICLHLCDQHPQAGFAPTGGPERAQFYKWLVYLTNTVQPELIMYFYPDRYVPAEHAAALQATLVDRVHAMFQRIDTQLAGRDWLVGERITVADLFLFMLSRWTRNMPKKARDLPNLRRLLDRVAARPAAIAVFEAEGLAAPLF